MLDCAVAVPLKLVIDRECDDCLLTISFVLIEFIFHEIDLIACPVPDAEIEVRFSFLDDELFLLDQMPLRIEVCRFEADDVSVDSRLVLDSNISAGIKAVLD